MDVSYEYRRIGAAFHEELFETVTSGNSAVLLSFRHLGKRYALRKLADQLAEERGHLVLELEFPHEPVLLEIAAVQAQVCAAVAKTVPDFDVRDTPGSDLLGAVRRLLESQPGAVVLLASNVDSLAHHLARLFLREVRALVSNPQNPLTAVLTGEENLRDFVCGEDSEFNCAHQFVLQGFEELEFVEYMRRRCETARIPFHNETECLKLLWEEAGGNIHFARAVLWGWLEERAQELTERPIASEKFDAFLKAFPVTEAYGMDVFHQTTRVIARSPQAWRDLESLKGGNPIFAPEGSPPRVVELAGLATRQAGAVRYASSIMQRFARRYYDACRVGDLYAVHGDWEQALRAYGEMSPDQRLRPCGGDDVPRLALVVKAFTGSLHAVATRKIEDQKRKLEETQGKLEKLKCAFGEGCQALLGMTGVSFWSYSAGWSLQQHQNVSPDVQSLAESILRFAKRDELGSQRFGAELSKVGAAAILPSIRPDSRDAVVLIAGQHGVPISQERQEVLKELLDQFAGAYDHCIANLGAQIRLKAREEHLRVATAIVSALGETLRNPRQALKAAGQELLKFGYRRIMFALVDPKHQSIRGISDCIGEECPADVGKETSYSLQDPDRDIQPWVVVHKQACVVDDWRTWNQRRGDWPKINDDLCRRANHRHAFAVVPMFLRVGRPDGTLDEDVFGTIHVERQDGRLPSKEDIEDLMEFGRQMAAAAHQAERVGALLEALDSDQDSVVVFDEDALVRFVNKCAAKRFEVPAGWHEAHENIQLNDPAVTQDTHAVILSGKPVARHDTSPHNGQKHRETIFCAPLPDWRREPSAAGDPEVNMAIGAVLQARDLTGAHRVFSALQKVAQSATDRESTITTVLEGVKELGYDSARLYLVDPQNPDLLVSVRALGLVRPEFEQEFEKGGYSMARHDPQRGDTWRCLETGEPRIHQWDPHSQEGSSVRTVHGVTVHNLPAPKFQLPWKEVGDVWIDLPLLANQRAAIGKLTIDCGKHLDCTLTPVQFELLKLFSALLGALLSALDKEQWVREAADKAMATCAHNIRTKLAALDGFGDRYRRAAPDNPEVEQVNQLHEPTVKACFAQVARLRETFAGMQLQRASTLLRPLLETTLGAMFAPDKLGGLVSWHVVCPADFAASLDADRIRNALEALLENSRAMLPSDRRLELTVEAEPVQREGSELLRLSVLDNGPGVAPDERECIFEPFYSRRPDGKRSTGLGLAYVLRVVKAHGGTIRVAERPEPGAEFIIEIPNPSKP